MQHKKVFRPLWKQLKVSSVLQNLLFIQHLRKQQISILHKIKREKDPVYRLGMEKKKEEIAELESWRR